VSAYGQAQKQGIVLALSQVNAVLAKKNRELEIITLDIGGTNEGAVAAITKLIKEDKVSGLIGPTLSGQALAADPIAQQNQIPVLGISNTAAGITEMGNFIFRCSLPESSVISGTVKTAAKSLKGKKVAVLWGKDDTYTAGGHQAFLDAIKEQGLILLTDETFLRGDTDYKSQLTKIIALQPDAIAVSAYVNEAALITVQARGLGFTGSIMGGNGFNSPEFIKQAGAAAEGVIVGTAWNMANSAPVNVKFIEAFQKLYGSQPDQFAAQAYTGVLIYADAISRADTTEPTAIRDALQKVHDLETPLGNFSFTENREPFHPAAIQIVRNGKFVILE
jgi:branched-chain amino acid transport system substrate-binding protein